MNVRTDGEADIANAQKPVHARGQTLLVRRTLPTLKSLYMHDRGQTLLGNGSGSQAQVTLDNLYMHGARRCLATARGRKHKWRAGSAEHRQNAAVHKLARRSPLHSCRSARLCKPPKIFLYTAALLQEGSALQAFQDPQLQQHPRLESRGVLGFGTNTLDEADIILVSVAPEKRR